MTFAHRPVVLTIHGVALCIEIIHGVALCIETHTQHTRASREVGISLSTKTNRLSLFIAPSSWPCITYLEAGTIPPPSRVPRARTCKSSEVFFVLIHNIIKIRIIHNTSCCCYIIQGASRCIVEPCLVQHCNEAAAQGRQPRVPRPMCCVVAAWSRLEEEAAPVHTCICFGKRRVGARAAGQVMGAYLAPSTASSAVAVSARIHEADISILAPLSSATRCAGADQLRPGKGARPRTSGD